LDLFDGSKERYVARQLKYYFGGHKTVEEMGGKKRRKREGEREREKNK
jgi:hypothetical protein